MLGVCLLAAGPARAQLGAVSNASVRGAFTIGFSNDGEPGVTNGTLRWNAASTNYQFWSGVSWVDIGTGDLQVTGAMKDEAFVVRGTNGDYYLDYGIRRTITWADWLSEHTLTNRHWTYPGQLIYYSVNGNTYEATNTINHTNYYPFTGTSTNSPPLPTRTDFFRLFVAKGDPGSNGSNAGAGPPGVGNAVIGNYSSTYGYDASGGTNFLVASGGSVWLLVNTNAVVSNSTPTVSNTNWLEIVSSGADGELIGITNLVFRFNWGSLTGYASNDYVRYASQLFYVSTNAPSTNHAPQVNADGVGVDSAYWDVLVGRGGKGATGPTGPSGAVITNITYEYTYVFTNETVNVPSNGYHNLAWIGTNAGGTNLYAWVSDAYMGTNLVTVSNGSLRINGSVYSSGVSNASDVVVAFSSTNFAGGANVEEKLVAIDSALGGLSVGGGSSTNTVNVTPQFRGNTGEEWTIALTGTASVIWYDQGGDHITNIVVTVETTNDLTGAIVIQKVSPTNSTAFPASFLWAEGSAPTDVTNAYHVYAVTVFRSLVTWASLGGSL